MKRLCLIILPALILLIISCGKNGNFPSTPDLTFKSIYPPVAVNGNDTLLTIICSFKDAEGDISGPVFFEQSNQLTVGFDSLYTLPGLPAQKNMQGNIILQLHDNDLNFPTSSGADTVTFFLYVKDKAGHISDTAETSKVVLITN